MTRAAKVKLRTRKNKNKDRNYYYLDIYFPNGNKRKTQALKTWIYSNPKDRMQRQVNNSNRILAEKERDKVQVEINEGLYEIQEKKRTILLKDLFIRVENDRGHNNLNTASSYSTTWMHLERFLKQHPSGTKITLDEIDENLVREWESYLRNATSLRNNSTIKLSTQTQNNYWIRFAVVMNDAVNIYDYLDKSPFRKRSAPEFTKREQKYLTKDELQALKDTPCVNPTLKDAFLFACCTGLRKSDIETLKWRHIQERNGKTLVIKDLVKGNKEHRILINKEYLKYIGERKEDDKLVFTGLRYDGHTNSQLRLWCAEAGIKDFGLIHSHTARHTFATQLLSANVPIYTVSQLLAHKEVSTTQREYSKYIPTDGDKWLEKVKFV